MGADAVRPATNCGKSSDGPGGEDVRGSPSRHDGRSTRPTDTRGSTNLVPVEFRWVIGRAHVCCVFPFVIPQSA
mgnify:CR=1 FL=1